MYLFSTIIVITIAYIYIFSTLELSLICYYNSLFKRSSLRGKTCSTFIALEDNIEVGRQPCAGCRAAGGSARDPQTTPFHRLAGFIEKIKTCLRPAVLVLIAVSNFSRSVRQPLPIVAVLSQSDKDLVSSGASARLILLPSWTLSPFVIPSLYQLIDNHLGGTPPSYTPIFNPSKVRI